MQLVVVNSNLLIHVFIYLYVRVSFFTSCARGASLSSQPKAFHAALRSREKRVARGAVLCGVRCVSQRQRVVLDGAEDLRKLDTHVWRKQVAMDHAQEGCDDRRRNI